MPASNNPYYIEPANPLQALMLGVQGYDRADKMAKQAEQDAIYKQVGQQIQSGGISDSALGRLFGIGVPAAPMLNAAAALQKSKMEAQGVYGTPIYGTDPATGKTVLGAIGRYGEWRPINTGTTDINPGIKIVDTGTGAVVLNSRSGALVGGAQPMVGGQPAMTPQGGPQPPAGYIPKDVQGEATQKKYGTEIGETAANLGQRKAALGNAIFNFDRMEKAAKEIQSSPYLGRITGFMGAIPSLPGTHAKDLEAKLENVKSQITFNVLQAMREASKTGGALGQVSNFENQLLQDNLAAVNKLQSQGAFKEAMQLIIDYSQGAKQRLQSAYEKDVAGVQRPAQSYPQPPQGGPPAMQGRGPIQLPKGISPDNAIKWLRGQNIPPGTPVILPDGSPGIAP